MGDLCCRLQPNGANSHYSVCKLCLFSPSFTSTPCTVLPSDVFDTCFRRRRLSFRCPVLLITGYLSQLHTIGNMHKCCVGLFTEISCCMQTHCPVKNHVSPKRHWPRKQACFWLCSNVSLSQTVGLLIGLFSLKSIWFILLNPMVLVCQTLKQHRWNNNPLNSSQCLFPLS